MCRRAKNGGEVREEEEEEEREEERKRDKIVSDATSMNRITFVT